MAAGGFLDISTAHMGHDKCSFRSVKHEPVIESKLMIFKKGSPTYKRKS